MKRVLAIVLTLLVSGTFAFAQERAPLQIICNMSGAQVFLSGQLIGNTNPNLTLNVRMGTYPISVVKKGYVRFDTTVTVGQSGATVQANLMMPGAAAPNTLGRPNTLAPPPVYNYGLTVSSNVNGAVVFINGNQAGQTPFAAQVPPGSYSVLVRAPGFLDYDQGVVVGNGPSQVNAMLQPMVSSWRLNLPENMRVRDNPGQMRGLEIWIDGVRQPTAPGQFFASGQLSPGTHVIRLVSGGMASETQVDVQAGRSYTFEPFIGINVR